MVDETMLVRVDDDGRRIRGFPKVMGVCRGAEQAPVKG
jgi:hypothetical protein